MSIRSWVAGCSCAWVIALVVPSYSSAQSHGVRLTFFDDPARSMAVSWNSDVATDTEIIYGTAPDALTTSATAVHVTQGAPLNNAFTARLEGLVPNTTYFYRVGRTGAYHPPVGEAPFQFTTLSDDPCDPITFVMMGDNRADFDGLGVSGLWSGILAEAMAFEPDFFVNTGDMVKNGDDPAEWAAFIDASETGWAYVGSFLTLGNHDNDDVDGDGALYNQLFEHARNDVTDTEDYYAIEVGPMQVVSLDSNKNGTQFADMVGWLTAELTGTTRPWKAVFFHHAIYSRGNHSSGEEDGGYLNAALIPVFDAQDVDFVFNGHSHNYERYAPSVGVDEEFGGSGRTFPAGDASAFPAGTAVPDGATGTTYMVSGGAGSLTTDVFGFTCMDAACSFCLPGGININCAQEVFDNDLAGNVTYSGKHGFAVFHVQGAQIDVEVWATDTGSTTSAEVIETFSMTSTDFPADLCGAAPGADAGPVNDPPDASVVMTPDASGAPGDDGSDDGGAASSDDAGCGCRTGGGANGWLALGLLALMFLRRRR